MKDIRVDYISDLHLLIHLPNLNKIDRLLPKWIDENLINEDGSRGDWLVVAGDIAEYTSVTKKFLTLCSERWEQVIFTLGNHDLWLVSNSEKRKYNFNSDFKRLEMKNFAAGIPNIHFLDQDILHLEGKVIAGGLNWYHLENPIWWNTFSNDSVYIQPSGIFNNNERSRKDSYFFSSLQGDLDLLVTHVPPVHFRGNPHPMQDAYFKKQKMKVKSIRYWICGHQHTETEEFYDYGSTILANPYGYPGEKTTKRLKQVII